MEVGEMDGKEQHLQEPWIPTTPLKPIRPKPVPICETGEGIQQGGHANGALACVDLSPGAEKNGRPHYWSAPAATVASVAVDNTKTCMQKPSDNVSSCSAAFAELLKSQFMGDPATNQTNALPSHRSLSLEQRTQDPQDISYIACCSKTTSQAAPPTPDSAIAPGNRQVAAMQINMTKRDQRGEEKNVPATNLDYNGTPYSTELCDPVIEFAAVSTPFKDDHNPENESSHDSYLNKTPQQKPRRRKHRPKVITEGKPKRTRKPVTQKPVQPKENTTGKRKYVRRKGLSTTSTTPTEVTGELAEPMMPESCKMSCRRSINFEIGARDEYSACRENATLHLRKEIGVEVGETNVGLAYDQNTFMKQALNNCMSLPEDTQASSTSLSKSNAPGEKTKENTTGKRKYVRRKGLNKTSTPTEATRGLTKPMMPESAKKLCRRSINFDIGAIDESSACRENATMRPGKETGVVIEETHVGLAYGVNPPMKQALNDYLSIPGDTQAPTISLSKSNPPGAKPKENPTGKRKYVRKKGLNKTSTEVTGELTKPMVPESAKMSCRRPLNFDIEARYESSACRENSTVHLGKEMSVVVEETHVGLPYDLKTSMKQSLNNFISLPEDTKGPSTSLSKGNSPGARPNANSVGNNSKRKDQATAWDVHENSAHIIFKSVAQSSPNDSNSSNSQISKRGLQMVGSKRQHSGTIMHEDTSSMNLIGARYNELHAYETKCILQFPNIQKKRRSEKGKTYNTSSPSSMTMTKDVQLATCPQEDARAHTYASSSSCWICGSEYNTAGVSAISEATESATHAEPQTVGNISSLNQTRVTKRSRAPARTCDCASLTRIRNCDTEPNHTTKLGISDRQTFGDADGPQTCNDALVAQMHASLTKKKQTEREYALFSSAYSSTNETQQHHKFALANYQQPLGKSLDVAREVICENMHSFDALAEQFRQLNINTEARDLAFHEQNALVPSNQQNSLVHGDGTIIPFQGSFDPIRKQYPRPKVDLDEETNRVWKLLMLDINSHGIDGTDEDKVKWWEEERNVFRGRADSFIARMHLVQGDRRFSQWKGSVVDSVIGVFLTQNVSDHLSSSAFMSLASRFPQKSSSKCKAYNGEGSSLVVNKPQVHIVEPKENTKCDEIILNQSVYDQSSVTIDIIEHSEEKEAVNSNDSCRTTTNAISLTDESNCQLLESAQRNTREHHSPMKSGPICSMNEEGQEKSCYGSSRKELNDILSSQCSVVSSQISGDFSINQNPEKMGSCSDSNSEVEDLSSTAKYNSSFNNSTSFSKLLEMVSSNMLHEVNSQRSKSTENLRDAYDQPIGMKHNNPTKNLEKSNFTQGSLDTSIIPSHEYTLKQNSNSGVLEVHCFDPFKTEASSSGFLKNKDENCKNSACFQTTESASHVAITHFQSMVFQLHPQDQSNHMQQSLFNISGQTLDFMQKARELDFGDQKNGVRNETSEINSAPIKLKNRGQGKEKTDNVNWDNLRIKAQAKAGKRETTENTMDSLDWDAVRCADVSEVADAIKERGMNNRLAERIKNFLNRLVEEHGSIDLEWLRDVPPDQAKEYLLSIRGLGLKSVECVRLLTLHHLAFPVDTNVGRIAVRLGWVPLQPLPESLQLHLLELYPVLESIQKYLWPRLCKLDQRTLYELHYQMITFGKVFCTKSKPNCNACPMRGECRHFASAFASARLALPGPEQRSIVSTPGNNVTDQNPSVVISQVPLALPENTNQAEEIQQTEVSRQLEVKSEINICQPIIEEPTTPELECSQVSQNDMEDAFSEDSHEIPTIKLNIEEFTLNLQNYMQENMELQEGEMSKALVALNPEAASIPMPKLKNVSRLRTEHCVYELPDSHCLLEGWERREPDDPGKYLLAIWTPGETANSIQPPERKCSSQECGQLCNEKECFSCNSFREANSQIVRGTILIPCRTAMRGSFPLNGTYFQVNEVFADHDSSVNPLSVPRSWIWNLNRRTVYFGTSIPTIFKGLSTQEIQQCFWRGYLCVRGFDRETRAPRPLMARLHFPASKLAKAKDKTRNDSASANSQGLKPNP